MNDPSEDLCRNSSVERSWRIINDVLRLNHGPGELGVALGGQVYEEQAEHLSLCRSNFDAEHALGVFSRL